MNRICDYPIKLCYKTLTETLYINLIKKSRKKIGKCIMILKYIKLTNIIK
jgi:hypothetical protein